MPGDSCLAQYSILYVYWSPVYQFLIITQKLLHLKKTAMNRFCVFSKSFFLGVLLFEIYRLKLSIIYLYVSYDEKKFKKVKMK